MMFSFRVDHLKDVFVFLCRKTNQNKLNFSSLILCICVYIMCGLQLYFNLLLFGNK